MSSAGLVDYGAFTALNTACVAGAKRGGRGGRRGGGRGVGRKALKRGKGRDGICFCGKGDLLNIGIADVWQQLQSL